MIERGYTDFLFAVAAVEVGLAWLVLGMAFLIEKLREWFD